jgi:nucleoid-associated protein YgaU
VPVAANEKISFEASTWRIETDDFIMTVERPVQPSMPLTRHQQPPAPGPLEIIHVVVRGDTLWHIAGKFLGNPFRYPELAALSRIANPDMIYPGNIVRIQKKGLHSAQRG